MTAWILLLCTIISAYISLDALGLIDHFRQHPKTLFKWIWGKRGESLFDSSPNHLKNYIQDSTTIKIATLCVGITLFFANATFNAFTN